jgi:hypothetical protein
VFNAFIIAKKLKIFWNNGSGIMGVPVLWMAGGYCKRAELCRAIPVGSRLKAEGEIPINSKVGHQGTVWLFLPTCTMHSQERGFYNLKLHPRDTENTEPFLVPSVVKPLSFSVDLIHNPWLSFNSWEAVGRSRFQIKIKNAQIVVCL